MNKDMTPGDRRILAVLVAAAGLLLVTVVPNAFLGAMDAVLKGIAVKVPVAGNPDLVSAPKIVTLFFPLWGGLSLAAGAALLALAALIYRGEGWARPLAVGLLAIPAIAGAYMSGPIIFFGRGAIPQFLLIMLVGLIPYFVLLLWGKAPVRQKVGDFLLFLLLGVTAAWSFSNGGSSLRILLARGEVSGLYVFLLGIPAVWMGVVEVMVGIPLLVAHTRTGWWLTAIGLVTIALGTAVLLFSGLAAVEFSAGVLMAVVSLALLLIPGIGRRAIQP